MDAVPPLTPGFLASFLHHLLDVSRNSCDNAYGKRISSTVSCRVGATRPFTPRP